MKELNDKKLEKVIGGEATSQQTYNVLVKYKETEDGMILTEDLGRYEKTYAETNGETIAREWCTTNNKIYDSYYLGDIKTNNYDTRILLDTLNEIRYS